MFKQISVKNGTHGTVSVCCFGTIYPTSGYPLLTYTLIISLGRKGGNLAGNHWIDHFKFDQMYCDMDLSEHGFRTMAVSIRKQPWWLPSNLGIIYFQTNPYHKWGSSSVGYDRAIWIAIRNRGVQSPERPETVHCLRIAIRHNYHRQWDDKNITSTKHGRDSWMLCRYQWYSGW